MRVCLIGDGSSDKVLRYPCGWLLKELGYRAVVHALEEPGGRPSLRERIQRALLHDRPDLLVVHRDAEAQKWESRRQEIKEALVGLEKEAVVGLVPVRMTEAWFLIDKDALLQAAGNPNGRLASELPAVKALETLTDPKAALEGLLKEASGLKGRRLRSFREGQCIHRLAELIRDYTPLRQLKAFQEFEQEVRNVLKATHGFEHSP